MAMKLSEIEIRKIATAVKSVEIVETGPVPNFSISFPLKRLAAIVHSDTGMVMQKFKDDEIPSS